MDNLLYRVLLVDNDEANYCRMRDLLGDIGSTQPQSAAPRSQEFDIHWVSDCQNAQETLRRQRFDICLLSPPHTEPKNGDLLDELAGAGMPFILLLENESDEESFAETWAELEVVDYLIRDQISAPLLKRSIRYAIDRKKQEAEISHAQRLARENAERLSAAEERSRRLFEFAQDGVLILDAASGQIEDVNPRLCQLLGHKHHEFLGRQLWEFGAFDDLAPNQDFLRKCEKEKFFLYDDISLVTQAGQAISVELASSFYLTGSRKVIQCNIRDITERKDIKNLFQQEHDFISAIVDTSGSLIIVLDRQGRIIRFNCACEQLTGYSFEEVKGREFWNFFLTPEETADVKAAFEELSSGHFPNSHENHWVTKNGERRAIMWSNTALVGSNGEVEYVIGTGIDITQRRQAEQALDARTREIVGIWESMTDAFYGLDTHWRFTHINSQAALLMQRNAKELIGQNMWDVFPTATDLLLYTEFQRALKDQVAVHHEEFFPPYNAWFEFHAYPSQSGLSVYFRDITRRKEAQQRISEQARSIDLLLNSTGEGIFGIDVHNRCTFVNKAGSELLGYSSEELMGCNLHEIMHHTRSDGSIYPAEECPIALTFQDGKSQRVENDVFWRRDGSSFPVSYSSFPIWEDGVLKGAVVTCTDITARKRAEEERDRFFTLSLDMLAIIGSDGSFKRLNPAFETTLGFSNAELMAVPFLDWVHPDDQASTIAKMMTAQSGSHLTHENRFRCHDGSYKWLRWMAASFEDLWYCVAHDITGVKQAAAALQKANDELELHVMERTAELAAANESLRVENLEHQMTMTTLRDLAHALQLAKEEADLANAAKSEFLSRMSHELRTPLNAILGFGQILDSQNLPPLCSESIGYILKGGRHLLGLINEVLDISRVEAGHLELSLEPIALADIVPEACALMHPLAHEHGITLKENTAELGDSYIMADQQRLHQVLINLLANAIKYNRKGGSAEIFCQIRDDEWTSIEIRDNGPGIAPEDLPKLFTPFQRLGAEASGIEGTGLGLVLSQRLMTAMGGTLKVHSTHGQGTTFTVDLPQAASPQDQLATLPEGTLHSHSHERAERPYRVLCVEDNPSNLRLVEVILESRPEISLLTAMQGSIGLDLARQHEPDLILLDLNLPDMHGKEVFGRLQQLAVTKNIPVVVVSADATPTQIDQLLGAGAKAYLTKPLDVSQFLHTLDLFLKPPSPKNFDSSPI